MDSDYQVAKNHFLRLGFNNPVFSQAKIADLLALNQQLVALDAVKVRLGVGVQGGELSRRLNLLKEELPRRVAAGDSSEQILEFLAITVSPSYRGLIEEWLVGADLTASLDRHRAAAEAASSVHRTLAYRLAYPVFVAILACLGLALMGHTTLPVVEATYSDLREPVGSGVAWAQQLRSTSFVWVWGLPIALFAGLFWVRRDRPWRRTGTKTPTRNQCAKVSYSLASLLRSGLSQGVAMPLAASSGGLAAKSHRPPLLAWAEAGSSTEDAASASDFIAIGDFYRNLAQRKVRRSTTLAPIVACVVLGGGATLIYALALFVPVVDLLWTLAY